MTNTPTDIQGVWLSNLARQMQNTYQPAPPGRFCAYCGTETVEKQTDERKKFNELSGEPIMVRSCPNANCESNCSHRFGFFSDKCSRCGRWK